MDARKSEPTQDSPGLGLTLAGGLAVAAGLARLIPHYPNFVPIGALGLFGGARLSSWRAVALPLGVMAATDWLLRVLYNYMPFDPFVYAGFLVYVLLGRLLCRDGSVWRLGVASVLGSVQFFLLTNFGAWLTTGMYPRTWAGLVTCYAAALPFAGQDVPPVLGFFGNTLLSDLLYTGLLFGVYALVARRSPAGEAAPAASGVAP
jgi:hypothetical protein